MTPDEEAGITPEERAAFERIIASTGMLAELTGFNIVEDGDTEKASTLLRKSSGHWLKQYLKKYDKNKRTTIAKT